MPFHSITIFTLAFLLPLSLAQLPQEKTPFKLAILYNKSIADAHPSFLLKEAILLFSSLNKCTELWSIRFSLVYPGWWAMPLTAWFIGYWPGWAGGQGLVGGDLGLVETGLWVMIATWREIGTWDVHSDSVDQPQISRVKIAELTLNSWRSSDAYMHC